MWKLRDVGKASAGAVVGFFASYFFLKETMIDPVAVTYFYAESAANSNASSVWQVLTFAEWAILISGTVAGGFLATIPEEAKGLDHDPHGLRIT